MTRQVKIKRKADGLNKPDPSKCKNTMEVIELAHLWTTGEMRKKWVMSTTYEEYTEIFNRHYIDIMSLIVQD